MIQILLVLSISFLVMTPIFSKKMWQRWTTYIARAQLTFQTFTLLQEYLYRQSQYSKPWDSKCLALIAQMVRTVDMNPKVGGSSPSQVETFSVSKTLTLSQKLTFVCRKRMLLPAHSFIPPEPVFKTWSGPSCGCQAVFYIACRSYNCHIVDIYFLLCYAYE